MSALRNSPLSGRVLVGIMASTVAVVGLSMAAGDLAASPAAAAAASPSQCHPRDVTSSPACSGQNGTVTSPSPAPSSAPQPQPQPVTVCTAYSFVGGSYTTCSKVDVTVGNGVSTVSRPVTPGAQVEAAVVVAPSFTG